MPLADYSILKIKILTSEFRLKMFKLMLISEGIPFKTTNGIPFCYRAMAMVSARSLNSVKSRALSSSGIY